ncbi:unnamed protein product [Owenia fusiformis]|uniref:Uncharacterized protein n=1 Tax=Owenia fusiformis TaxID=6347 RepID=A0A8J1XJF1_OWEFU|nr:unnamed protein product [Owenia fusiformis]
MFTITIPVDDIPKPRVYDPENPPDDFELVHNATHYNQRGMITERLPTPEKHAIMELSESFTKRRLGAQQKMLTSMAQRCREQEIKDLSGSITRRYEPHSVPRIEKNTAFYSTTHTIQKHRLDSDSESEKAESPNATPRPNFEKSKTFFPTRTVYKAPKTKPEPENSLPSRRSNLRSYSFIPQSSRIKFSKGVRPVDVYGRKQLISSQRINGPIQLDHYTQPKADQLAPLVLPSIAKQRPTRSSRQKGSRVDTYITSQKITLGDKTLQKTTDGVKQDVVEATQADTVVQEGTIVLPNNTNLTKGEKHDATDDNVIT